MPSNSTISPRNGPKRRQKAPKSAQCAPAPRNQERAVSWATWLKVRFRGHLVHPQPPTFYGFQASESPHETRRPPYQWSLGGAGGPANPRTVGANGGSTRVPRAKKMIFPKVAPRPLVMHKQVFLGRLEPVVARFGSWKIPKCLENGPFWDQQWVKNGPLGVGTRHRGGHSETPAGGQPGPTRAAPPAAFGVAARGGGSCGGCGSGGRPQRGTNQPDDAADRGQVRACDMRATCLHSVLRSVLRSVEREKGRGGRGRQGGSRGTKAAGACSATCVPQAQGPGHQRAAR